MKIINGTYEETVKTKPWVEDLYEVLEGDTDKLVKVLKLLHLNFSAIYTVNLQKRIRNAEIRYTYHMLIQEPAAISKRQAKKGLANQYRLSTRQVGRIVNAN